MAAQPIVDPPAMTPFRRKMSTFCRRRWYAWMGPTTAHLRYECFLLASLLLLTVGSLRGLYRESFGTRGDFLYLLLTAIVGGRHLLFRWLTTWDPSTHASPTLQGLVSHMLQSHCTGGQTFDRPGTLQREWLHRRCRGGGAGGGGGGIFSTSSNYYSSSHSGTSSSSNYSAPIAAADRLLAMTAVSDATVSNAEVSWVDLLPSTVFYAWQWVRVYLLYPLSRWLWSWADRPSHYHNTKHRNNGRGGHKNNHSTPLERGSSAVGGGQASSSSTISNIGRRSITGTRRSLLQEMDAFQEAVFRLIVQYGPSLQFSLSVGVFLYYKCQIYEYRTGLSPMSLIYGRPEIESENTILSVNTQNTNSIRQAVGKYGDRSAGVYKPLLQPTERDVLFVMLAFGTLFGLLVFSRIVPPLPDFVAGGNVLKDVRQEARAAALEQSANAGNTSSTGKRGSRNRSRLITWPVNVVKHVLGAFVETGSGSPTASDAAPWTERQRSIVLENRLHMAMAVVIVRCLENLVLFGILPRTHFACRATAHCPPGPPVWELARVLYPGGHTQARRLDGWSFSYFMERDRTSMVWTVLGVAFVSLLLLVAQTVLLSKSYLSTMAYVSGEWVLVDHARQNLDNKSGTKTPSSLSGEPTVWDLKRKYKKGELVYYPHHGDSVYQAMNNGPEGRPRDRELYGLNERLKQELGHSSMSSSLSDLAVLPVLVLILHWLVYVGYFVFGKGHCTYGMPCAMLAHSVAAYALVSVARPGAHNLDELKQLHAEVIGQTTVE